MSIISSTLFLDSLEGGDITIFDDGRVIYRTIDQTYELAHLTTRDCTLIIEALAKLIKNRDEKKIKEIIK